MELLINEAMIDKCVLQIYEVDEGDQRRVYEKEGISDTILEGCFLRSDQKEKDQSNNDCNAK